MVRGGIKSRDRVSDFGEVYTPKEIVNEMLDMIKEESYDLDKRFLEPSCGNGNFLLGIIERKLDTALKSPKEDLGRNIFRAVASVYGIDILEDNIAEAKKKIMRLIKHKYVLTFKKSLPKDLENLITTVLDYNIILGDALSGTYVANGEEFIIVEWVLDGNILTMKEYLFNNIPNPMLNVPVKVHEPIDLTVVFNSCV